MNCKNILFLGTHGQYNIGDELLLETFLSRLGPQHEYTVNSYDPEFTLRQLGEEYKLTVFHTIQDRFRLFAFILKNDLLFFGGGSIIKELYASIGRNRYATLLMILGIVGFAKIVARKRIVMSNIGVGPIQTKVGFFLARLILSLVDFVSVRDQSSYEICQQMKLRAGKVELVPDAVFVHEAGFFLGGDDSSPEHSNTLKVALNLNYDIENPESWGVFIQNLAEGLLKVHQQRPLQIHALPMQSGFKDHHDLDILSEFQARIPEIEMIMHTPTTTQDMGKILSSCDIVVAERLHACISAAIIGTPFLALIYDTKVRQMAKILGMEAFGMEIDASFNAVAFAQKLHRLTEKATQIEGHLRKRTQKLREGLQTYFGSLARQI